jgi:WhiB family redox-sensing transcriptional regulator
MRADRRRYDAFPGGRTAFRGASSLSWLGDAECRDMDPDLFFPPGPGPAARIAVSVCNRCPVMAECARYRTEIGAGYGIWGGRRYAWAKREEDLRP